MRTRERVAGVQNAERVLEVGAERKHVVVARCNTYRQRAVSTRAADHPRSPIDDADHRVVIARVDLAIVQEKSVGDRSEAQHGLVVVLRDRLLAHVAAGHDERHRHRAHEEVMQRRVRQHHTEFRHPWRDGVRHPTGAGVLAALEQARSGEPTPPAMPPPRHSRCRGGGPRQCRRTSRRTAWRGDACDGAGASPPLRTSRRSTTENRQVPSTR